MADSEEVRNKFYDDLNAFLAIFRKANRLVDLGNLNARVGTGQAAWEGVLSPHEICGYNDNGLCSLRTCAEHHLLLANIFLDFRDRKRQYSCVAVDEGIGIP
ncbi:unnamed protein product [Schistocephalus solidus]|uniref:Uncharacterized protein n=1 Tax=Schistocephalus solidus TaxID=70667 RepID=A0A183SIT9_SCHSO|nr:unnamed protein product [Schistocephalus solidus]